MPLCRRSGDKVSTTKACTPPSQATLTNPTSRSSSKAQTQPRLWRSTCLRQSMSSTMVANPSAWRALTATFSNGARHSYRTAPSPAA